MSGSSPFEIVHWHFWVESLGQIALIFLFQCIRVIFAVPQHKDLAAVHSLDDVDAGLVGLRQQAQPVILTDVGGAHLSVARVRRAEDIVKSAQQRLLGEQHMVPEDTGHLARQLIFGNAVVMIQARPAHPSRYARWNGRARGSSP